MDVEHHDGEWPRITLHINTAAAPSHTIIGMVRVFEQVMFIAHRKDQAYGAAWIRQGWMGNLARMMSKTARLKNMLWRSMPFESETEPVHETAYDLIALSTFFILNRDTKNQWGNDV